VLVSDTAHGNVSYHCASCAFDDECAIKHSGDCEACLNYCYLPFFVKCYFNEHLAVLSQMFETSLENAYGPEGTTTIKLKCIIRTYSHIAIDFARYRSHVFRGRKQQHEIDMIKASLLLPMNAACAFLTIDHKSKSVPTQNRAHHSFSFGLSGLSILGAMLIRARKFRALL
jgi:hypothetical protein